MADLSSLFGLLFGQNTPSMGPGGTPPFLDPAQEAAATQAMQAAPQQDTAVNPLVSLQQNPVLGQLAGSVQQEQNGQAQGDDPITATLRGIATQKSENPFLDFAKSGNSDSPLQQKVQDRLGKLGYSGKKGAAMLFLTNLFGGIAAGDKYTSIQEQVRKQVNDEYKTALDAAQVQNSQNRIDELTRHNMVMAQTLQQYRQRDLAIKQQKTDQEGKKVQSVVRLNDSKIGEAANRNVNRDALTEYRKRMADLAEVKADDARDYNEKRLKLLNTLNNAKPEVIAEQMAQEEWEKNGNSGPAPASLKFAKHLEVMGSLFDRKAAAAEKAKAMKSEEVMAQLSPGAQKMLADMAAANGGQLPRMLFTRAGAPIAVGVFNDLAARYPDINLALNSMDYKARSSAMNKLAGMAHTIGALEGTIDKNMDLLRDISKNVQRGQSPLWNKYLLWKKGQVDGDTETIKLGNIVKTIAYEVAWATAPTGGRVTDKNVEDQEERISKAMSDGTINKVLDLMKQEVANRGGGFDKQMQILRDEQTKATKPTGAASPAPPPPPNKDVDAIKKRYGLNY